MIFTLLADLVVLLHLAFIVFVVAGGFLALRWRRLVWAHLPAAVWGAAIEIGGWVCPLTPFENWLRRRGDASAYAGGFIEHYVVPVIYPPGLARPDQLALGVVIVLLNVVAYGLFLRLQLSRRAEIR